MHLEVDNDKTSHRIHQHIPWCVRSFLQIDVDFLVGFISYALRRGGNSNSPGECTGLISLV